MLYRQTLTDLKLRLTREDTTKLPLLIFVNKGIERGTNALTLEIIADTLGPAAAKVAAFIVSSPFFPLLFSKKDETADCDTM